MTALAKPRSRNTSERASVLSRSDSSTSVRCPVRKLSHDAGDRRGRNRPVGQSVRRLQRERFSPSRSHEARIRVELEHRRKRDEHDRKSPAPSSSASAATRSARSRSSTACALSLRRRHDFVRRSEEPGAVRLLDSRRAAVSRRGGDGPGHRLLRLGSHRRPFPGRAQRLPPYCKRTAS